MVAINNTDSQSRMKPNDIVLVSLTVTLIAVQPCLPASAWLDSYDYWPLTMTMTTMIIVLSLVEDMVLRVLPREGEEEAVVCHSRQNKWIEMENCSFIQMIPPEFAESLSSSATISCLLCYVSRARTKGGAGGRRRMYCISKLLGFVSRY